MCRAVGPGGFRAGRVGTWLLVVGGGGEFSWDGLEGGVLGISECEINLIIFCWLLIFMSLYR